MHTTGGRVAAHICNMLRVPRRVDIPRDCDRCYCRAAPCETLCSACMRAPPGAWSALDMVDDDGSTCGACRTLLCPLHASFEQRSRRRCGNCAERDSEDGSEEEVTTPLSYRHAFGIEYDSGSTDSSLDDVDEAEEERQLQEMQQLHEMTFVDWLLGNFQEQQRKRPKLSPCAAQPQPYRVLHEYEGADTCAICLDALTTRASKVAVMHCHPSHMFHQSCVDTWLTQEAATCPLCQRNFASFAC